MTAARLAATLQPATAAQAGGHRLRWHSPQAWLLLFTAVLWVAMCVAIALAGIDERTLRGAVVWLKPAKFMASIGLFAATTAWWIGLLPAARRSSAAVRGSAAIIVAAGSFEVVYITLQAALGQGSHYNTGDTVHFVLYSLMGIGALAMTATQPWLAYEIARHGRGDVDRLWRRTVVLSLVMTFVLGAGAGIPLSLMQPPSGSGVPLLGWHLAGDLRPAHFIGMHAQQLLPMAGLALRSLPPAKGRRALAALAIAYALVWGAAMIAGLSHRG